uniref:Uncharacterized protein n=1 Tax=Chromera velia CCMP2878 TaxID=1169474 RepID=A0A0G4HFT4_9ALVE|eukprot:Cvel_6645.t1-p1 / transcript=Cvel_6645.t1 / gene=Cvel_6645 / organism=Chromera_velia_CCMP2878 / gene_product=hypothetical protein / transcript_product=hypothetical protein / location=Cvel_scaffold329:72190-73107(-) / protein_length=191 / sequence_SO=supercontig / SO=protein_coding / is_pseudo=false
MRQEAEEEGGENSLEIMEVRAVQNGDAAPQPPAMQPSEASSSSEASARASAGSEEDANGLVEMEVNIEIDLIEEGEELVGLLSREADVVQGEEAIADYAGCVMIQRPLWGIMRHSTALPLFSKDKLTTDRLTRVMKKGKKAALPQKGELSIRVGGVYTWDHVFLSIEEYEKIEKKWATLDHEEASATEDAM